MITQADSRKWMACLYNSFLFMEAKIMKMAKKLLAVVLTGVMAVSMLTGCALSDKVKAEALENALNSDQVKNAAVAAQTEEAKQKQEKATKYDYKSELNKVVGKVWGKESDNSGMKAGKAADFTTNYVGKLTEQTVDGTKYFVYVVDVTKVKTSQKSEWTTRAVDLRKAVTTKGFGTDKIKNYNTVAENYTAKFGIDFKSVTTGENSNKKTTNYAIVVFEKA